MSWINYFKMMVSGLALFIIAAGCSGGSKEPELVIGEKAPPLRVKLISGETWDINDMNGKSLIVTFMSSWCPCSNESIPLFKKIEERYKEKDIAIIMIGIQDSKKKFEKFVNKKWVPFPAGYDDDKRIARAYGIHAPPTTVFIDKDRNVKRAYYGNIADIGGAFFQWVEEVL